MKKSPVFLARSVSLARNATLRWIVLSGIAWFGIGAGFAQQITSAESTQQFQVLSTRQEKKADRTITYNKVVPPVLTAARTQPTVAAPPIGADANPAAKADHVVTLTLSYYPDDETVTELSWMDEKDQPHRVYSNVDFSNFPAAFSYTFNGTYYSIMFMLGVVPQAVAPGTASALSKANELADAKSRLAAGKSYAYVPAATNEGGWSATESEALDMLHSYYTIYREQLISDRKQREAAAEIELKEVERKAREPVVVNFWKKTPEGR